RLPGRPSRARERSDSRAFRSPRDRRAIHAGTIGRAAAFELPALDPGTWQVSVAGLVERSLNLSLRDLMNMPSETLFVTLECAGNGRTTLDPPVEGEKWDFGAVSTAEWKGVPLVEVLDRA